LGAALRGSKESESGGDELSLGRQALPLAAIFALSLVVNLLMLTGSLFMLQIYDRVLGSRSLPTLDALTVLVVALYGFYGFLEVLRARMAMRFGAVVEQALSARLFRAAIRLRLSASSMRTIDPVGDLGTLRRFISGAGPLALLDLPWLPVYLTLVYLFHPMLGWLAVLGALLITALLIVNEFSARRPSIAANAANAARQVQSTDARSNAESVMAMGMLGALSRRWDKATAGILATQRMAADRAALFSSVTKAYRFLLQSAVLALGAYLVIEGQMSAGLMFAASLATARALAPVEQVVAHWRGFIAARQALNRIKQVLDLTREAEPETVLPLPQRTLSAEQLSAGPSRATGALVTGVSFELLRGEALGVVGPSGSGKSSLARALVGVWPTLLGEVRLDGSPLRHFGTDRLGRMVGYLPQRVELFDGTIAENISRFAAGASSEAIMAAAITADVHGMVTRMPDGYDTRIGEAGSALSAGQCQRIGLARALYGDPFLIVLDEPNSNLDGDGDDALTAAVLAAKARGAVIVVVAHRSSAIAGVDKLLLLQNGRQVAYGAKAEVLRRIKALPGELPQHIQVAGRG
jgi:ATP-binding cassette subfamily C protein PrsD